MSAAGTDTRRSRGQACGQAQVAPAAQLNLCGRAADLVYQHFKMPKDLPYAKQRAHMATLIGAPPRSRRTRYPQLCVRVARSVPAGMWCNK